jgi:hypothetical protein
MRMNWLLPTPVLLVAGVVALVLLASLLHQPVSLPRLAAETVAITLGEIVAFLFGWVLLWLIEHHW